MGAVIVTVVTLVSFIMAGTMCWIDGYNRGVKETEERWSNAVARR